MKTTVLIEPNKREFWLEAVTAYAGMGQQRGLSPGSEKPNDF